MSAETLATLSEQIAHCMLRDRHRLRGKLRSIRHALDRNEPVDQRLVRVAEEIARSNERLERRKANLPKPTYPLDLPVVEKRDEIAKAIAENQVIVLCGETGSGKTTQLPKICLELGRGVAGMIGHTQPRRIAARSVANRLAQEMQTTVGNAVGFKVRFTDVVGEDSFIKLMTDGILLAEIQSDRFLEAYDTIIIDEAHERSLNIDFLLGYLRQLLPKRPDLKLIITSATIDPQRFSKHFNDAPIVMVSGRTYPVEVRYRPLHSEDPDEQEFEQQDAIKAAVDELLGQQRGDILIFLSGEREIRETAESLRGHLNGRAEILPLYARLSGDEQMRVFAPHQTVRIVLATNVAETSLTVPGIKYVIDPGYARISRYNPRTKIQRLPTERISQASADQRKGRCGRVSEGVCIRLYSEEDYASRPQYTDPEILRTNLASVILQMKALRLGRIEEFPFLEPPDYRQVRDGYQTLFEIHAIDETNELTDIGRILARLPIDPRIARMCIAARDENCLEEVLIIAAGLSVQDPRERPMEKQGAADTAHAQFRTGTSDFLGYLNLWRFYHDGLRNLSGSKLRKACKENYLSFVRLREWQDILRQVRELVAQMDWRPNHEAAHPDAIHRALLTGLLHNIGNKGDAHEYTGVRGKKFHLFPGSALFHKKPPWVMAAEIVETSRTYARTVAQIDPVWVERAAAHLVHRSYSEPHWQRKTARVVAYEKVVLHGLPIVPKRTVAYGNIDPKTSREIFIHSALVDGDYDTNAHFFRHNLELQREVELMEAKVRRRDILADARTRFAFYDARVPAHVVDGHGFERWRRKAEGENKRILFMRREDLMARAADEASVEQFPTMLKLSASLSLPLEYRFDPGHALDGVTLTVKLAQLNQVPLDRLDWLVPGLIEEKAADLIRTLPKPLRVNVVPVPEFARRAVAAMTFGEGNLVEKLAVALGKLTGLPIPANEFKPDQLPDYLKMNVRVLDEHGRQAAMGRDLRAIKHQLRDKLRSSFEHLASPYVRDGIKGWDFGDLPERVEIRHNGATLQGYPAIVDRGDTVSLRLLDSLEESRDVSRGGVRRLFVNEFQNSLEYQISAVAEFSQLALYYKPIGTRDQLRKEMAAAIADRLVFGALDVRSKAEFERRLDEAWNRQRPVAEKMAGLTQQILEAYHAVTLKLPSPVPPMLAESVGDVRQQLKYLMPANFLTATPRNWLEHLPRFLRAVEVRLRKLMNAGLSRDQQGMAQVKPLWQAYLDRISHPEWRASPPPLLLHVRWMIEELRVSLFAQELKTSLPVSVQRIEKHLAELPLPEIKASAKPAANAPTAGRT